MEIRKPGEGRFIVLEGLDGTDTFQHAVDLVQWLINTKRINGGRTHLTREPSDGPIGNNIRMYLEGRMEIDQLTLATFFSADRMDHLYKSERGINDRLKRGEFVICDRYYLSSYAYQGIEPKIGFEWIKALNSKCISPDLTIYIDLPIDHCLGRMVAESYGGIHFALFDAPTENYEDISKHMKKVKNGYSRAIKILRGEGEPIEIVKKETPENIEREIRRIIERVFEI